MPQPDPVSLVKAHVEELLRIRLEVLRAQAQASLQASESTLWRLQAQGPDANLNLNLPASLAGMAVAWAEAKVLQDLREYLEALE